MLFCELLFFCLEEGSGAAKRKKERRGRGGRKRCRRTTFALAFADDSIESLPLTLTSSSAFSSVSAVTDVHSSVLVLLVTSTSASRGRANGGRGGGDEDCGGVDVAAAADNDDDDDGCCSAIAAILRSFGGFCDAGSAVDDVLLRASRKREESEPRKAATPPWLDLSEAATSEVVEQMLQPVPAATFGEQRAAACIVRCEEDEGGPSAGAENLECALWPREGKEGEK